MVEMRQCGMCGVVWNVLWDSVMCMAWCEVLMWACDRMVCPDVVEGFDASYGAIREMWCDMECCNFRHGAMWNAIEMRNVGCGKWRGVACGVMACGGVDLW